MKKRILAIALALSLLLPFCGTAFAETEPTTPCLHKNAEWELLVPPTLISESHYVRECPDCGFRQTARKARTSFAEYLFDLIARMFFLAERPELSDNFTVTAHTGPGEITMNSMFSLRYSLQSGADTVEFDLALNDEGTAVMAHDSVENAPTLEEGFALVAKYVDITVNVDVKNIEAVEQAQELAIRYGILDRIFYTGVYDYNVSYLKEHSPLVPYYLNVAPNADADQCEALCENAASLGAIGLNFNYNAYSPELAAAARRNGLLLSVYTVNSIKDMRMCLSYDIDNITSEFPYKLYTMTAGFRDTFR